MISRNIIIQTSPRKGYAKGFEDESEDSEEEEAYEDDDHQEEREEAYVPPSLGPSRKSAQDAVGALISAMDGTKEVLSSPSSASSSLSLSTPPPPRNSLSDRTVRDRCTPYPMTPSHLHHSLIGCRGTR
jgi:hypothetical protein